MNSLSRDDFAFLTEMFSRLSSNGYDLYQIAPEFLLQTTLRVYCANGGPQSFINVTLKSIFTFSYFLQTKLIFGENDFVTNWFSDKNDDFCTLMSNIQMRLSCNDMSNSLLDFAFQSSDKDHRSILIVLYIFLGVIVFFILTPLFLIIFLIVKEIKYFGELIVNIDQKSKESAAEPIRMNPVDVVNTYDSSDGGNQSSSALIYLSFIIILYVLTSAVVIAAFILRLTTNKAILQIERFSSLNSQRPALVIESITHLFLKTIIESNFFPCLFSSVNIEKENVFDSLNFLDRLDSILSTNSDGFRSLIGFDKEIDKFMYQDNSEEGVSLDFHESYKTASTKLMLNLFKITLRELMTKDNFFNGSIADEQFQHLYHIAFGL